MLTAVPAPHSKLADYIKEREQKKSELSTLQMEVFRKRCVCPPHAAALCPLTSALCPLPRGLRFLLEDWSGSILSSLRPMATQSANTRQSSVVTEGHWEGRAVYISVSVRGFTVSVPEGEDI